VSTSRVVLAAALPLLPALAALAGLLVPARPGRPRAVATGLAVGAAAATLVAALALAAVVLSDGRADLGETLTAGTLLAPFGPLEVSLAVRVGPVTVLVAVMVAAVALCVQVYSTGYLASDDRYPPYAAQVSLFTAAMLLVVVAGDLVLLLVGWEVMGLCSYLLIGHDRTLPEAPAAAVKAFLVTRVGDVGFLLGVVVLGVAAGTFRIDGVLAGVANGTVDGTAATAGALLLLAGVAGKSAQFPLHTWLPDAMAGPTPISALIHAATMVAAGVYVVAVLAPLYAATPVALAVLGVVAAVTMLLGAGAALVQDDLKRVLAWSTVSQIAYMTGALAVAATPAALFHLLSHAAFKALLFLAAGAVLHGAGVTSLSAMGGLRRTMPVTFAAMTVGLAALVGLPPLAGFWSKEAVLGAAEHAALGEGPAPAWVGWVVLLAGLATVALTAAYAARLWLWAFLGESRRPAALPVVLHEVPGAVAVDPPPGTPVTGSEVHEPGWAMRGPVLALVVPTVLLGLAGLVPSGLPRWLGAEEALAPEPVTTVLALALAVVGGVAVWAVWRTDRAADPARVLGPARPGLAAGLGVDAAQDLLVVRPARVLARLARRADERLVDGAVEGTGSGARALGGLVARLHAGSLRGYLAVLLGLGLLLGALAGTVALNGPGGGGLP